MKKPLALFLIINLFLTNLYAQSSLSSVIYDSINNIDNPHSMNNVISIASVMLLSNRSL